MMLTVHGLPIKTKFQDVKALIKQECNIPDFILDNLVDDGYDSKKVRIGLTNENDGYRLMKCLDGFRMSGSHVLKVVPIGKPPTPQTFEPRSGYSNQPRNDYPKESLPDYSSRNDYNRGQPSTNNPSSHISPRDSARNIGMDTRVHVAQSDRGLLDSRQSLSQAMSDSRSQQDRYQGSLDRPALDTRGPQATDSRGPTDFRNPSRGLLAPPAIRPASMDARGPMLDSRGQHGPLESGGTHGPLESAGPHGPHGIRGHDGPLNYRGSLDHRQVSNPESIRQPQWTSAGGNDQWSAPNRPMQNQNVGYNYQQPQGNTGYGQQPSNSQPAAYTQGRAPLTQGYQQPKIDAPDRPVTRPHVLRSVELVDSPIQPRAPPSFPPHQKPITIMKENFQGPTQYNVTGQVPQSQGPYQSQAQAAWAQQGQGQTKQLAYDKSYDERRLAMDKPQAKPAAPLDYEKRRFSPPRGRPASPERGRGVPTNTARPVDPYAERRVSPPRPFASDRRSPGRHIASISNDFSASGRRMSPSKVAPTGRRISPTRKLSPRRVSSPGRRVSPPGSGRRISPFARNISPNRKIVGRPISPSRTGRRISPPGIGRRISPPGIGRRVSPPGIGRRISPPGIGRRISPPGLGRRISPPGIGRRISPSGTGRRISPFGRKISPTGQRTSPGRHISQTGRRISPGSRISPRRGISPGRRISPSGRRVSPTGGRVSPTGRRISPTGRRISPPGKRGSPVRRDEPRRMSPSMTKYDYYVEDERRGGRLESPRRYSPKRSPLRSSGRYSPSEIKYECDDPGSKGSKPIRPAYEPNQGQKYTGAGFRPNETQYPASASRNDAKISPWQNDKITYPIKKEEREIHRMSRSDAVEKKLSPRRSRSRSPVKDRYRRHSPSPRSPRRSWALEKRRSPDATREPPPPPLWPGQESEDKPKHPVWERNNPDEDRRFDDKSRDEKYTPRFSPRREIDDRREYRDELKFESNYRPEDRDDYRRESLHHDDKKLLKEVDKDFNDIYQRAVEFRRKTEELRKSNDRRNRSYDEEEIKEITPPPADRLTKSKPNWIPIKIQTKDLYRKKLRLDPSVKDKRDKAVEEIACRILEPHHFNGEQKQRIMEELKFCIYNIMLEMFKDKDVSYIELVIKFRARYDAKDEEKILLDVLKSMPSHYKDQLKRKGEGITEVPSKVSRRAPDNSKKENKLISREHSSSKLTSRHEPRRHGVKDGRIMKTGGLGWSSRAFKLVQKDPTTGNDSRPISPRVYEEVYDEAKPKVELDEELALEEEPKDKSPSVARTRPEGYTELSPLMTKMVEEELKNIMINVWQTLPDDPTREADRLVVDKFKNTAGDDLRNTIGLTVTKRLLNIHNGINVKVKIYPPVMPEDEYEFAKKYNISDFKYLHKHMFSGELQSWPDLDDLYTAKRLRCDYSEVIVTPIYNFMKCPENLRTIFDGNSDYSNAKAIENEAARKVKKTEGKAIVTADKVLAQKQKKENANKDISKGKVVLDTTPEEVKSENKTTKSPNKNTSKAVETLVKAKNIAEKVIEKKPTVTKQSEKTNEVKKQLKPNEIKTEPKTTKVEPSKGVVNKPSVKPSTPKVATPKPNEVKKPDAKSGKVEPTKKPVNEPTKLVANKPSVATNYAKKEIITPKPSAVNKSEINVTKETPTKTVSIEPNKVVAKEPAKTASKESAIMVSKEQAKTVAKVPSKTVAKEPAKPVAKVQSKTIAQEPAQPIVKVPSKTVAKEPTKAVAKEPSQLVAKEPAKTVAKEAAKTVAKEPSQLVAKEPAKTVAKEPSQLDAKEPAKTVAKVPSKTVATEPAKPVAIVQSKPVAKVPSKTVATEPAKPVTIVQSKPVAKVPSKTVAKEPAKPVAIAPSKTVAQEPAKPVAKVQSKTVAQEQAKPVVKEPTKTVAKQPVKPVIKEPSQLDAKDPAKTVAKEPTKMVANKIVTTKTPNKDIAKPKPAGTKKPDNKAVPVKPAVKDSKKNNKVGAKAKNQNDFDELNDHDILALLSSGIVLDECSGSDED